MSAGARYAGRSVLVTGGHGFIGSWLVERLAAAGAQVLVPRRSTPADGLTDLVSLDLADMASLMRALEEHDVDAVFHLAAQTVVGQAGKTPLRTLETNIRGTYNLLEACRLSDARRAERRVVVASSAQVYGKRGGVPNSESAPLRPIGPYEASKACTDMIARCYAATHDMPVAVTRMSNVYGGGDLNFSRLVPASARALLDGLPPVIHTDGTPKRDYLYVEDAVDAYLAVEQSLGQREFWGRAWNVGADAPIAVMDVVRTLTEVAGSDVQPEVRGQRGDEVDRLWLDSEAIRAALGWAPRWTLTDALEKTYAWYAEHLQDRSGDAALATFADTTDRY